MMLRVVLLVVLALVALVYYFGGTYEWEKEQRIKEFDNETAKFLQNVENKVAADAVREYEIAKRGGDRMDACVHAGFVAAAFLQANDEANYRKWKKIEDEERKLAGLQ